MFPASPGGVGGVGGTLPGARPRVALRRGGPACPPLRPGGRGRGVPPPVSPERRRRGAGPPGWSGSRGGRWGAAFKASRGLLWEVPGKSVRISPLLGPSPPEQQSRELKERGGGACSAGSGLGEMLVALALPTPARLLSWGLQLTREALMGSLAVGNAPGGGSTRRSTPFHAV